MILEEGNRPYPRCPKCEIFVSHKALNGRHLATAFCQRGEERKRCHLAEEEARAGTELAITAYGIPLAPVTPFKYLGRVLSAADDGWPEVVNKLWRARKEWAQLTRVLSREGADARTLSQIYLAVGQSFMLYGSEMWVITPRIGSVLGGFHQRVDQKLTRRQPRRGGDGVWFYPSLENVMA